MAREFEVQASRPYLAPQQSDINLSLHQGIGELGRGLRRDRNVYISRLLTQDSQRP
jgi:hypothetical protein